MTVRACREYRAAMAAGFHAQTTYDIKSEAFLKTTNAILAAAALLRVPIISYIRKPHRGVADIDFLPSSVLPCVSSDDAEMIAGMKGLSLGDLLRRGQIKILGLSSSEISLEWLPYRQTALFKKISPDKRPYIAEAGGALSLRRQFVS